MEASLAFADDANAGCRVAVAIEKGEGAFARNTVAPFFLFERRIAFLSLPKLRGRKLNFFPRLSRGPALVDLPCDVIIFLICAAFGQAQDRNRKLVLLWLPAQLSVGKLHAQFFFEAFATAFRNPARIGFV